MHFLIDGHNLIAKMPGISLSDPDAEAQLILRLRRWVAANPTRRVTVYFDGGLPGGRAPHLSATRLEVVFASSGQPADDLLLRHIRRLKNPPEYTLVSSDRKIIAAAEKRRVPVLLSEDFAPELAEEAAAAPPPPREVVEKPLLNEAEVAAWMELFGPEPEIPRQPRRPRLRRAADKTGEPPAEPAPEPPAPRAADELKASGEPLTPDEVAAWLAAFEERPAEPPAETEKRQPGEKASKSVRRRKAPSASSRPADVLKRSGAALNADEVDEWLTLFRDPKARK